MSEEKDKQRKRSELDESLDDMLEDLDNTLHRRQPSSPQPTKTPPPSSPGFISIERDDIREKQNAKAALYRDLELAVAKPAPAPAAQPDPEPVSDMDDGDMKVVGEPQPVSASEDGDENMMIYPETTAKPAEEDTAISQATRIISGEEIGQAKRAMAEDPADEPDDADKPVKKGKKKKKKNEAVGCLKSIIYVVVVLAVASILAYIGYVGIVDVTGIGRSTMAVDITVPEGASTEEVAELLKAENIIDQPLFFRVYCRLTHADGSFHSGIHTVTANMGYNGIVDELSTIEERETVSVTIPEGATIDTSAALMEENKVCSAKDFYTAVVTGNYTDYDFIAELTAEQRQNRVYQLEGYLFPDTYEFYQEGAAETAVRTMLNNFGKRVNADTRASIKASGKTLNEVLIEASIAQKEAGKVDDMPRVARVLLNRLNNTAEFPCIQFDSTEDYLLALKPPMSGVNVVSSAYNTYTTPGLPAGAICNPGLAAINAVLNPSEEPEIINCYYFASIVETGESAFFETFDEHEAWCIEHGVGMYGD